LRRFDEHFKAAGIHAGALLGDLNVSTDPAVQHGQRRHWWWAPSCHIPLKPPIVVQKTAHKTIRLLQSLIRKKKRKVWIVLAGDSILMGIMETILMIMGKSDFHAFNARKWDQVYSRPLMPCVFEDVDIKIQWSLLGPIVYDRHESHQLMRDVLGIDGATKLAAGHYPDALVMNAGLWDVQERPISEYVRYLPLMAATLATALPRSTNLVWVLSPPVDVEPPIHFLEPFSYRTNCALWAQNEAALELLSNTRWDIVDSYRILNAMRFLAVDGRHYPPVALVEVAGSIMEKLTLDE